MLPSRSLCSWPSCQPPSPCLRSQEEGQAPVHVVSAPGLLGPEGSRSHASPALPHLHMRAPGYLHFPPAPDSTTTAAVPALPALPPRASVLRKASLATSSRPFSSHRQRGVPVSHQQRARQEGKADGGPGSRLPPRLPCGLHACFPGQK